MQWIKKVYLYLVSLVSLIILVVAAIMLINLALKSWVFPKADRDFYYEPQVACAMPPASDAAATPVSSYIASPECADPTAYKEKMAAQERENRAVQKQRDASQAIAMIIVAAPVFFYHWRLARKET